MGRRIKLSITWTLVLLLVLGASFSTFAESKKNTHIIVHVLGASAVTVNFNKDLDGDGQNDTLELVKNGNKFKGPDGGQYVTDDIASFTVVFDGEEQSQIYDVSDSSNVRVGVEAKGTINYWLKTPDNDFENIPPVAEDDSYSIKQGEILEADAIIGVLENDTDADGYTLTAVLATNPQNGTLTLESDGSFIYTPDENFNGEDFFTYKANNGITDSNVATVTITVKASEITPENTLPVANDDSYSVKQGEILEVDALRGILSNDTDVDGDMLTAALVSGPSNGTLILNLDGSFKYTPNKDFFGDEQLTYSASDGNGGTSNAVVYIHVVRENTDNGKEDNITYYTLTTAVEGKGAITPAAGKHSYKKSSTVKLTAVPADGWNFESWKGDSVSEDNTIRVDGNKSVTAVFVEVSAVTDIPETEEPAAVEVPDVEVPTGQPVTTEASGQTEQPEAEVKSLDTNTLPDTLPKTGGIPPITFYSAGMLLSAAGIFLRKKK